MKNGQKTWSAIEMLQLLKKRLQRKRVNTPTLQEHFFRLALLQKNIQAESIKIDHHKGQCWSKVTGWRPLVFPQSLVTIVSELPKEKTVDYFFQGVVSGGREWTKKYPNIQDSSYGRDPQKKYVTDIGVLSGFCGKIRWITNSLAVREWHLKQGNF